MYISKPLFTDLTVMPKNQSRLLNQVVTHSDPHTNVGFINFEKTTPSQAQRIRGDIRELVKLGYVRKYPMTKASVVMKAQHIRHNRRINFYMVNPIHQHATDADRQGLKDIWLLLR